MMNRRNFISGLSSLPIVARPTLGEPYDPPLKELAARKGLLYGTAINLHTVINTPLLAKLIIQECSVIVSEWEMKWKATQAANGPEDFTAADKIAQFAICNNILLRGHTLAWGASVPEWAKNILHAGKNKNLLRDHIAKEITHFSKSVFEWDVANEAIEPMDRLPDGYRDTPLYRAFGPDWIAEAFRAAHTNTPNAMLYYNDYDLEEDHKTCDIKREAVLNMLSRLLSQHVPIHGLGLQAHLRADRKFNPRKFSYFLADVQKLGLKIKLTELDVDDRKLPDDTYIRDKIVADTVFPVIETALENQALTGILTWGLTDRDSYRNRPPIRMSGDRWARSLPYDDQLRPKPFRSALARAFVGAPNRPQSIPRPPHSQGCPKHRVD